MVSRMQPFWGLRSLPVELLQEVVGSLCLHCTPPPLPAYECGEYRNCTREEKSRVATLASLCLTSRSLNEIATRYLYHRPIANKWWLLLRTLITAKDKARQVKQLQFGEFDWADAEFTIPDEVSAYYDEKLDARTAELKPMYGNGWNQFVAEYRLDKFNMNTVVDLVTCLCPNAEQLQATIDYFWAFSFCAPNSLLALKHIELWHADTEGGIHVSNITTLLRAGPNLTSVRFQALGSCGDLHLTLNHVRHLDIRYSALQAECLGDILRACPNLETLSYEAGGSTVGYEQFTPREAKDMIVQHAPNLKSFSLNLGHAYWFDDPDIGHLDMAQSMAIRGIDFSYVE